MKTTEVTKTAETTRRRRPGSVTAAAVGQLLMAAAFLSIPILGFVYAGDVQAAAEAEVTRQGLPATVLADNNLNFAENGPATAIPVAVALCLAILAVLNLAGRRLGRTLSWIVMPIVLLGNIAIMISQATAVQAVEAIFAKSEDARLHQLQARALLDAVGAGYPDWTWSLVDARNVVVMLGSLLVVVLLAVRPARVYFRKVEHSQNRP